MSIFTSLGRRLAVAYVSEKRSPPCKVPSRVRMYFCNKTWGVDGEEGSYCDLVGSVVLVTLQERNVQLSFT